MRLFDTRRSLGHSEAMLSGAYTHTTRQHDPIMGLVKLFLFKCRFIRASLQAAVYSVCSRVTLHTLISELHAHSNAIFDLAWVPGGTKLVRSTSDRKRVVVKNCLFLSASVDGVG